ncbi:MAG: zinc metalloprotease HtpX [Streptosporangiales bacterium]|nr:zinc metalloprotease HtpX [Streptosporangiales bacterium]
MTKTRFAPDKGLTARMGLTMFLLGLVYTAFIAGLIAMFWRGGGWVWVVLIAAGFLAVQFLFSDKIALAAMRGHVVTPEQAPELHAMIDRLTAMANMPKPKVAISNSDIPNAFAIGRSPKSAVVCASTGMMRQLTTEELEAVLAHELSHVAHRDVAVMTIASFLGVLAGMMARMGLYAMAFGGGSRDQNGAAAALVMLGVVAVSAVVYGISFLLIQALSRYRELAADRAGAHLTGRPSVLASALQKVSGQMASIPNKDLRKAEAYNAFFFAPLKSKGFSFSSLFSTHPSLEKRLAQLAQISTQLGEVAPGQQRTPGPAYDVIPGIDQTAVDSDAPRPVESAPRQAPTTWNQPPAQQPWHQPHSGEGYPPRGAR